MKNWRTTIGGILGGVAGVAAGVQLILNHQYEAGAAAIASGLGILYTGLNAPDKQVMKAEDAKAVKVGE